MSGPKFGSQKKCADCINTASATIDDEILDSVAVVGGFLRDLGRWSDEYEVRAFHFRKICESAGTEHPSTLTSMNNLALVLSDQGKHEQAEEMHRQALGLRETVLGKEHPSTLTSMNNLANVLRDQGKYEQAEEMHRQALGLCETLVDVLPTQRFRPFVFRYHLPLSHNSELQLNKIQK
jgi:tetratricopeptide (TPR) repeat protein